MTDPVPTVTAVRSPFLRLAELLGDAKPGLPPIIISVGEPQHAVPSFVGPVLAANVASLNKYPQIRGTDGFRQTVARWAAARWPGVGLDPMREVVILAGSREGLFYAALAAATHRKTAGRRKVLMPNPFYQVYAAGAQATGAEPFVLDATRDTGFLPELNRLPDSLLADTQAFFLCSPANPQGTVASAAYLDKAIALARHHGFWLFIDECYSEIYPDLPPPGGLEIAAKTGSYDQVVVFNSLSKRSNLAGLRVGFTAGDADFLDHFCEVRATSAAQVPIPAQDVGIAAYSDEAHVIENRALYRAKFDLADRILGNRFGYRRPAGGFFLWLDVSEHGGDELVTQRLWAEGGVKVLPGSYLGRVNPDGSNPGRGYIRCALTNEHAITEEALTRLVSILT